MTCDDADTLQITRRDISALRELMIRGVALSDRVDEAGELSPLATRAPLGALAGAAWIHRLSGTLERSLARVPEIPTSVIADLRGDAEEGAIGGLLHLAALHEIGAAFDREGISWLTMKGPVVSHLLYTRPSDRQYADLDLLVDRGDFEAAVRILEGMRYEHMIHNWFLAREMMAGQIELITKVTRVDLHWHLHYSSADRDRTSLVPGDMLDRARRVHLPGQQVPTFDPVDTLLNLAFHAARSDGHRLIWLKDIERSLVVETPDLDELVRRARHAQCGPQVGVMLIRVRDLLDAPVPDEVVDALVPAPMQAFERSVRRVSNPVRFHERATLSRFVTRSIGHSTRSTFTELPVRGARRAARFVVPPAKLETDDPVEQQRFFDAVAASRR